MNMHDLPDFPHLFETIGWFLESARVPPEQQDELRAATEAFRMVIGTLYQGLEKIYPCNRPSRIAGMLLREK